MLEEQRSNTLNFILKLRGNFPSRNKNAMQASIISKERFPLYILNISCTQPDYESN